MIRTNCVEPRITALLGRKTPALVNWFVEKYPYLTDALKNAVVPVIWILTALVWHFAWALAGAVDDFA